MTVQTVKLGRERFVLLREKDYRQLKAKADRQESPGRSRRLTAQDRGDIAEARRRRNESAHPYSELRKELGLK
jgi:PHD/YefM family antitoxin component YafN of YafNO toxin-antitoxin module